MTAALAAVALAGLIAGLAAGTLAGWLAHQLRTRADVRTLRTQLDLMHAALISIPATAREHRASVAAWHRITYRPALRRLLGTRTRRAAA